MKKKAIDILNKVLALKQQYDSMPQPEPVNAIVLTTTDGVQVSVDKAEVGGVATINGMPAPANTYTFTDGSSIVTDANGIITAATPAPAPAATPIEEAKPAPAPAPAPQPAPSPAPMPQQHSAAKFSFTDEHKAEGGIEKLFASFAAGTTEDRVANLETVCKAMMEYCFGWEIKQAKEKSDRDNAIKVYTDSLAALQTEMNSHKAKSEAQKQIVDQMFELVNEFVTEPNSNPPHKTKTVFSLTKPKGSLERYQAAAQKIAEEKAASNGNK